MKHRFSNEFYKAVVNLANHKGVDVSTTCKQINHKVNELSGLVSVQGALAILCNEIGLPVGILR